MTDATIDEARIAPGHDGKAELLVFISYDNGARDHVTLDAVAAARLMEKCQVCAIEQLQGHSWRQLLDVLE